LDIVVMTGMAAISPAAHAQPCWPEVIGRVRIDGALRVAVAGDFTYVAAPTGFFVIDISDSKEPAIVGSENEISGFLGVAVIDSVAYIGGYNQVGDEALMTVDISDPEHLEPTDLGYMPGTPLSVALANDLAYVIASPLGLVICDGVGIIGDFGTPYVAHPKL
jgi:hypothetical protein